MMRAIFREEERDRVTLKMQELGLRGAYERFQYNGSWYLSIQTNDLSLFYYCKGLLTEEERKFFY